MSRSHKKKRNSGLLYEFLVRYISSCLVEGDSHQASKALKLIKRHFKPGTQLYNEFRLINSLVRTTVSTVPVASSILLEAKRAANDYDQRLLDREKSLLIRAINHSLKEGVYDQHIDEYKTYATVQVLLNEWRSGKSDIGLRAKYEDQLMNWLMQEKDERFDQPLGDETPGTSRLLMNIITKKLNEKYSATLTNEQKDVIRTYAWSTSRDDLSRIREKLVSVRNKLLESLNAYCDEHSHDDEYVVGRLFEAKERLDVEDVVNIDDSTVARFMLYMKLNDELTRDENDA